MTNATHDDGLPKLNEEMLFAGGDLDDNDFARPADRGDDFVPSDDDTDYSDDDVDLSKMGDDSDADDSDGADDSDADDSDADDSDADDSDDADADDADDSDADDSDADADDADDSDADDKGDNKEQGFVPRWRLNQETRKRREMERRLEALEKGQQPQNTDQQPKQRQQPDNESKAQLDGLREQKNTLRDQYEEALIDGDTEKVKEIRGKLDDVDDQIFEARVSQRTKEATDEATTRSSVQRELDAEAATVAKRFAAFDSNDPAFDSEATTEVASMRDFYYQQGGVTAAEALREAAETVAAKYRIEDREAAAATKEKAKPKAKAKPAQSKAKARAKAAQPKRQAGRRTSEKPLNVLSMTDKEFDEIPSDQLARERGDIID